MLFGGPYSRMGTALAQAAASKQSCDATTKICFQSYTSPDTAITYGVALPTNVTDPYDAIVSITAPVNTTWAGFSWGGTMSYVPLTVAWPNGKSAMVSSRMALYGTLATLKSRKHSNIWQRHEPPPTLRWRDIHPSEGHNDK